GEAGLADAPGIAEALEARPRLGEPGQRARRVLAEREQLAHDTLGDGARLLVEALRERQRLLRARASGGEGAGPHGGARAPHDREPAQALVRLRGRHLAQRREAALAVARGDAGD